jgi:hypothetical protein
VYLGNGVSELIQIALHAMLDDGDRGRGLSHQQVSGTLPWVAAFRYSMLR